MKLRRLLLIDYSGDFREAHERLHSGGKENYYAQRYSIDSVAATLDHFTEVVVVTSQTETAYDVVLDNGIRAIGLGMSEYEDGKLIRETIAAVDPSHLMFRTLFPRAIIWAITRSYETACCFPMSMPKGGWRRTVKNRMMGYVLNSRKIRWLFAYGLPAAESYRAAGVNPRKIVAWDFLHDMELNTLGPKTLAPNARRRIMFVGRMTETKGIGDVIDAVAILHRSGMDVELGIAGIDTGGHYAARCKAQGIANVTSFYGMIENDQLEARMREHDVVVAPSHWEFGEGFPLVIAQSLRARVPVVVSDHPVFVRLLRHHFSAMIAPQKNPEALSKALQELLTDEALYRRLSEASQSTIETITTPVKPHLFTAQCFGQLPGDGGFLDQHSLAALSRTGV